MCRVLCRVLYRKLQSVGAGQCLAEERVVLLQTGSLPGMPGCRKAWIRGRLR